MLPINGPGHKDNKFAFADLDADPPRRATVITPQWCNAVQEELISVITASGKKPEDKLQLQEAIETLISAAVKSAEDRVEKKIDTQISGLEVKISANETEIAGLDTKITKNTADIKAINDSIDFLNIIDKEAESRTTISEFVPVSPGSLPTQRRVVYGIYKYSLRVAVLREFVFLSVEFTPTVKRKYYIENIGVDPIPGPVEPTPAPDGRGDIQAMTIDSDKVAAKFLPPNAIEAALNRSSGASLPTAVVEIDASKDPVLVAKASQAGVQDGQPHFENNVTYTFIAQYRK